MPAPAMSNAILTGTLIIMILMVPIFFNNVVNNVWAEMVKKELKEVSDYVADTIANLYFLVNNTNANPVLEKILKLPSEVGGSDYSLEITLDSSNFAQTVKAYLNGKSWLYVTSWLPPGLKVNTATSPPPTTETIQSRGETAVAGCQRISTNVYVWIAYKE